MVKLLEGDASSIISKEQIPTSTSSYAITFSSNSCLKWSENVCEKATYFCSIDGHIILFEKPAFFEDAYRDCILRNGFLSKFW